MTTPPFLLGASLIFWGWQTGLWTLSAVLAVILEASRILTVRWDISEEDYSRVYDLCTLIFIGLILYLFFRYETIQVIFRIIQWLPAILFPVMFLQTYGKKRRIDIRALSLIMRKEMKRSKASDSYLVNLSYLYFILVILSAASANIRTHGYFVGMIALSVWALWQARSSRYSVSVWLFVIVISGLIGYGGQIQLNQLQLILEKKGLEWFEMAERWDADPYQSMTAIGYIGELKQSNRILFRVKPESDSDLPLLLREACYDKYNFSTWYASTHRFEQVLPDPDAVTWRLMEANDKPDHSVIVSAKLSKGKGMLKIPLGTFRVERLPVLKMEQNRLGAVRVSEGPALITYEVRYHPGIFFQDLTPSEYDLAIPESDRDAIRQIIEEAGLKKMPHSEAVKRIPDYFETHFRYSLDLEQKGGERTPIGNFLLHSRYGHCEYFATATVFILRSLGIPARYATGFSAHETGYSEGWLIVRDRHAHAWAQAYINGSWQDVDATPSQWRVMESKAAPSWEWITDMWAWMGFKFLQWRMSLDRDRAIKFAGGLLILLMFMRMRRLRPVRASKKSSRNIQHAEGINVQRPGKDSEFYLIEKQLSQMGFPRQSYESIGDWVQSLSKFDSLHAEAIPAIVRLHYRYRFDPKGISLEEREKLKTLAHQWLADVET